MLKWKREGGFPHMAGPARGGKKEGEKRLGYRVQDLHVVTLKSCAFPFQMARWVLERGQTGRAVIALTASSADDALLL